MRHRTNNNGVRVEICDLGAWTTRPLFAEYDRRASLVRVNARMLDLVRDSLGADAADAFLRHAIAHELFHARRPDASEAQARETARAVSGVDAAVFEELLCR
ncbi:MAG TPA: hypothetical protein VGZ00_09135 [Candidatus Baltobacteraceae bacterium]|jgi:hypothetical protein|nr:hypothetical protein [Candidatus Baltobacteraceae bacterium]